jgi:hypothetical protein
MNVERHAVYRAKKAMPLIGGREVIGEKSCSFHHFFLLWTFALVPAGAFLLNLI